MDGNHEEVEESFYRFFFFFPSYFLYCSETQENSIHPWSVFFCYISLNPNIPCVLLSFFLCQVSVAEWFDNKVRLTQIYKGYIYMYVLINVPLTIRRKAFEVFRHEGVRPLIV